MSATLQNTQHHTNPLDNVEDILHAHNWSFDRQSVDELNLEVTGKIGKYRLFFIWQEDMNALQFYAQMDLQITPSNLNDAREAILKINEDMWMGHFDIPKVSGKPNYRYTCLLRDCTQDYAAAILEDMVDVSMAQCERHFPLFSLLASANDLSQQHMSLAMMDIAGES